MVAESSTKFVLPANYVVENTVLNCSEQFFFNERTRLCSPLCGEWEEFSHSTVVAFFTVYVFLYIIHLIGTVTALTLSCVNYKIM